MTSPTQRTLKMLRDAGHTVAIVEKWNQHAKIRQDLFGFADLISFTNFQTILWQVTTEGVSSRIEKIRGYDAAKRWAAIDENQPRLLIVCGWRQIKPVRGKRSAWSPRLINMLWDNHTEHWSEVEFDDLGEFIF